jgi:ribosome biogenesis GTPase
MSRLSENQLRKIYKSVKLREKERERWKCINEEKTKEKFRHRSPTGDARIKESTVSMLVKKVDNLIIVSSFVLPPLKTGLIDRFLIMAEFEEVKPIIVLNKSDLLTLREEGEKVASLYQSLGYHTILTSTTNGKGIDLLKEIIQGKTSLLAGHSGVGKTSLLKFIFPELPGTPETREVSISTKKGKHSTTTIKHYQLPDNSVIFDLPGIKITGLYGISSSEVREYFPEFKPYSHLCKFDDCLHKNEPACKVKEAVEEGLISKDRYESYLRIAGR